MIANFETIPNSAESSFTSYLLVTQLFEFNWHYHPEYELTFIRKGNGNRLIGNYLDTFSSGDLVLLGPNVPHTWGSEKDSKGSVADVIQFGEKFTDMLSPNTAELEPVLKLLHKAKSGLIFRLKNQEEFQCKLENLQNSVSVNRLLQLIEILHGLVKEEYVLASASTASFALDNYQTERMDKVFQYINKNFAQNITIGEMAEVSHLTPTSFCRFFKKNTGKHFTEYLNELRINSVKRALLYSSESIGNIAFANGFNNIVHFNRIFKQKLRISPGKYRIQNQGIK